MGCFQSTELPATEKPAEAVALSPAAPEPDAVVQTKSPEPVVTVPRAVPQATDVDVAKLKLLTMRDKLYAFLMQSDETLKQEALLAITARKQGKDAMFNVFLKRRAMLKEQVSRNENLFAQLAEQIDKFEEAEDNAALVRSIEKGTEGINKVMKDLSVERVQKALDDNQEAVAYTEQVEAMLGEQQVGEEFYTDALAELDAFEKEQHAEQGEQKEEQKDEMDVAGKMPDVPTQMPVEPAVEANVAAGVAEQSAEKERVLEAA